MVASAGLAKLRGAGGGSPASKIAHLGAALDRPPANRAWAPGPKRASQIIIENDPYHITVTARRSAAMVAGHRRRNAGAYHGDRGPSGDRRWRGLNGYLRHLQTVTGCRSRTAMGSASSRRCRLRPLVLPACQRRRLHIRGRIRALVWPRHRRLERDERYSDPHLGTAARKSGAAWIVRRIVGRC